MDHAGYDREDKGAGRDPEQIAHERSGTRAEDDRLGRFFHGSHPMKLVASYPQRRSYSLVPAAGGGGRDALMREERRITGHGPSARAFKSVN